MEQNINDYMKLKMFCLHCKRPVSVCSQVLYIVIDVFLICIYLFIF